MASYKRKNHSFVPLLNFCAIEANELRTLLTIATWESSFRELTLFASSPLPKIKLLLNHSPFHLSIASKSIQTCLPLFHASSIIPLHLELHVSTKLHHMPSSVLSLLNLSLANGLVNKTTNWCPVLTNWISQSPFWTWSWMKWCLISICLVLECCIGFLVKLMALVLSQYKGTFLSLTP